MKKNLKYFSLLIFFLLVQSMGMGLQMVQGCGLGTQAQRDVELCIQSEAPENAVFLFLVLECVAPLFFKPLLMTDQGKSLGEIGKCNCIFVMEVEGVDWLYTAGSLFTSCSNDAVISFSTFRLVSSYCYFIVENFFIQFKFGA